MTLNYISAPIFPATMLVQAQYLGLIGLTFAPGQTYTGLLFDFVVSPSAPGGTYTGSFQIGLSSGGPSSNLSNAVNYSVDVQAVPEPASGPVTAVALLLALLAAQRKVRSPVRCRARNGLENRAANDGEFETEKCVCVD
jgi:hypothetical protein